MLRLLTCLLMLRNVSYLLLCGLGSALLHMPSMADTPPTPASLPMFTARYQLSVLGLPFAQAERRLERASDNEYRLSSHAQTTGVLSWVRDDVIKETSRWRFSDHQLQPLHYSFAHLSSKRQRHREISFDWDQLQARSSKDKEHWVLNLQPGTLDMLLSQLALTWQLLQNPTPTDFNYIIAHNDKVKTYRIQFNGEEELDTALGVLRTFKFTRRDPHNEKRSSVLWCAPKLHYLPVRIEHTEPDDDTVRAQIETVSFDPKTSVQ